jgi:predicted DNA-binding transcriptional regulator YafY
VRKADRLFEIIQILRRSRKPVTAHALAVELETSKRSVYRDIAALLAQQVPIRGEAGVGYVLDRGLDMPPLMLTTEEIEAAVLGAQWVVQSGDPQLARAARNLVAKIEASVPERLRPFIEDPPGYVVPSWDKTKSNVDLVMVRAAINGGRKMRLAYSDAAGRATRRVIWPIMMGYFQTTRTIAAWCETRKDFRSFRADRIEEAEVLEEKYPERPSALRHRWRKVIEVEREKWRKAREAGELPPGHSGG